MAGAERKPIARSEDLPIMAFESQHRWEDWLDEHHADATGAWLKIAKKGAVIPTISYAEALEGALCYGWIDGQKAALDDRLWLQKFTPRRAKSIWSKVNREKALELVAAGKMRPPGQRQIELAQADGRWEAAYESQRTIVVPPDLQSALESNPGAAQFFATLDSANRYAILWRIQQAKRPQTRDARIEKFIGMLSRHEKVHPS